MSVKKSSTARKTSASQQTYTAQARAIMRRIDKAEESNMLDCTLEAQRLLIVAKAAWDLLHVGAPDFIILALTKLISDAARSEGLPVPTYENDESETVEQAIKKIADIFCIAIKYKPAAQNSPAALAEHIAAIVKHPLTPVGLFNALADELCELDSHVDHNAPEYLERALVAYQESQREVRANA